MVKADPFTYKPLSPLRDDTNVENILNNIQANKENRDLQEVKETFENTDKLFGRKPQHKL